MIIRSKCPLRLGFAGGGTDLPVYSDVHGGCVLNATISLFVHCTLIPNKTGEIGFFAQDMGISEVLGSQAELPLSGDLSLFKGIYNRIIRDFNVGPLSFNLYTYSDVASGSGLGGSSALVVAILSCFREWLNLPLGDHDIALLAYKIEREDLNIIGGAQDQYAATFGGFNFMEFSSEHRVIVNPLRVKSSVILELEESTLLYFTGVTRKAGQIEEEKSRVLNNSESLNAMHRLKEDAIMMKEFLLRGDIKSFSTTIQEAWLAKKAVSPIVSNDEIEKVFELGLDAGAISGKVSGAGGGGFMFFMVDPVQKLRLKNVMSQQMGRVLEFNFVNDGVRAWSQ